MADSISIARARRLALAAQGFTGARVAEPGTRQLTTLIRRLELLQLDSVNVFERSHYLPPFARLGAYDRTVFDRIAFGSPGRKARYVEYWAHAAALVPVETLPLLRHRMEWYRERHAAEGTWASAHRPMLDELLATIRHSGPMAASEVEHEENVRRGPWWGWSDVKRGLEVLFATGELISAGRTRFERRYGLPEQVLPPGVMDTEVPRPDATRELIRRSIAALGVATVADARDHFRIPYLAETKQAVRDLLDEGAIREIAVEGWREPAYVIPDAVIPRRIDTVALLSPFDPIVWFRDRGRRLFGFDYTIEIYLKAHDRRFGYYTLPLLVDDALVGRIDLKSDRQRGVLRVQSAWTEEGAPPEVEQRVVPLLHDIAGWQGLDAGLEVADWGDLAPRLAGALGVPLTDTSPDAELVELGADADGGDPDEAVSDTDPDPSEGDPAEREL